MRWNDLFADLEGQLEAELGAQADEERAEQERFRIGRLTMRDRILRGPELLEVQLASHDRLTIRRVHVGKDWVSGELIDGGGRNTQVVVPLGAVAAISWTREGIASSCAEPRGEEDALAARLAIGFVLRDLCRRRVPVELRGQGTRMGTIDRVGRDHLDIARHELDQVRAERNVFAYESVALAAIEWIRVPQ